MGTLNSLHLPDALHHALQRRAAARGITVEEQLVRDLESLGVVSDETDEASLVSAIRMDRDAMAAKGVYLTDEELKALDHDVAGQRNQSTDRQRIESLRSNIRVAHHDG